jgi:hypothetical protein
MSGPSQDLHGSDGIGDTPYAIDVDNIDHYPLVNPYGKPSPQTYNLTITTTDGGTTTPPPGTYTYTINSTVQVTAVPDPNYLFDHWELDTINVSSANAYTVWMNKNHTIKAVFSLIPPPLVCSINPLSASIRVGEFASFNSTVSGGTPPYSYQWYLNSNPVSGGNTSSWTFTFSLGGIYYTYLIVTDAKGTTTQSETARIEVISVPVGGYSSLVEKYTITRPPSSYFIILLILICIFATIKKSKNKELTTETP